MNYPRPQRTRVNVSIIEEVTHKVIRVRFKTDIPVEFLPGQFVNIIVEKGIQRSYSISSIPSQEYFETYVDISPTGPGSKYFQSLKVGEQVDVILPLGRFVYQESDSPVCFIATGTGITPFMSMINFALAKLKSKRNIKLIFGLRQERDIFYQNELEALKKKHDNFDFKFCISRDSSDKFFNGRVTSYLQENAKEIDLSSQVYICGGKDMIHEVEDLLLNTGVSKESIYYEQFY